MVTGGPVTTDAVHESSNDYLLNEIDRQITKIRPMATPVDQLSRLAGVTHDDDVRNADGEGYLRGRNEKIEFENRFDQSAEARAERNSVTPRFARRSIWDIAD